MNTADIQPSETRSGTMAVLIVEDDPLVTGALRSLLCEGDFSCEDAETLAEALGLLEKKRFDAVLLDLGLSDSSGLNTAVKMREHHPEVPIIVLTGMADESTALEALSAGIQDYLIKGRITGELLIRCVRYVVDRKRTYDSLKQSEAKYRGLFDTMTEAFDRCRIILDDRGNPVDFRYLDVNKAWERATGIPTDRATGRTARELVPDIDQGLIEICGSVALTRKPVLFNQYNKRLDKWFEVYLYSPQQGYFATFSHDITDHKKAEEALQQSEERLRLASRAASFGTYDIDIESRQMHCSPELKELYGLPPDAETRVPLDEGLRFVHPDDREQVLRVLNQSMDPGSGGFFRLEHRIVRTDGRVLWVNMRGRTLFTGKERRPVRITGVLLDITDRKQAEEALRESEARYRALVHTASSVVWRTSADGSRLLELSGAVARQYIEPEKRAGEWLDYIHPEDRQKTIDTWKKAVEIKGLYEVEHRNLHPDGTYHYYLSRGVPVLAENGEVREWIGSSIDITQRRRAEQDLRESEERFRTLADNIAQLAWMADERGWVFWYNKRWFDYTGSTPEEMRGWGWTTVQHPDHRARVIGSFRRALVRGEEWDDTFPLRAMDGTYRWFLCRAIPIRNEEGRVVRWFGTDTDITERRRMEEEIKHMAQHDILTGLPNRRLFNEIIGHELAQARRNNTKVAVLFLDLDRFKQINDTLGHQTGDELLKQTAARLQSVTRSSDTVARLGGDEFNVLIPDIQEPEYASEVAQKILDEIRRPFMVSGHELMVSTSIGISVFPDDSEEVDTLMRYADIAMYYAKEHGRNMHQFYNPVINTRSLDRIRFENSLERALSHGEFQLYYQPLVTVSDGGVRSAEVLLRWQHPEHGLLLPDQFLPAAENIGFMPEIDAWVLKTAASQVGAWARAAGNPVCVSVNLSNSQFQDPDLVERISRVLAESGMPPECLNLEITESMAMDDTERMIGRLRKLDRIGVSIAIDRFGTGCSSLHELKRLPVRKLKMDMSFVRDIPDDANDRAIVRAVLLMAHTMKLRVAAAGVEKDSQLRFLREVNCDEAQGFYFNRPMPAEEFRGLVERA